MSLQGKIQRRWSRDYDLVPFLKSCACCAARRGPERERRKTRDSMGGWRHVAFRRGLGPVLLVRRSGSSRLVAVQRRGVPSAETQFVAARSDLLPGFASWESGRCVRRRCRVQKSSLPGVRGRWSVRREVERVESRVKEREYIGESRELESRAIR